MPADSPNVPRERQTGENICPDCMGRGLLGQTPCPTCDGSGRVVEPVGDA